MSEIFLNYSPKTGFTRAADKGGLTGKVMPYADFKTVEVDCESSDAYGIILDSGDVQDFIANYEVDSVFTDGEK